eukprot:TRINITY_DN6588_c0_g1_i1.p1 TRINITY_DN6588_c0_g1~~TRINITY_DN6588_c0_g1_i1.p1  ORF type:complete len:1889 (+),score=263.28 TRINITY_DN6588_c0_g1_i1:30-5669(+)
MNPTNTLQQLGKNSAMSSSSGKFPSLSKWFHRVIENEGPGCVDQDDEIVHMVFSKEQHEDYNEKRLNKALKEWENETSLCVGVIGSCGTGKSRLINTVLEATACEQEYKTNVQNEVIVSSSNTCKVELEHTGTDDDGLDLQWLTSTAREKEKSEKSHMKVYSKATSYSFQGPNHHASGSEEEEFGFSINDFLGPHQKSDDEDSFEMEMVDSIMRQSTYKRATVYLWDNPEDGNYQNEYEFENASCIHKNFAVDDDFIANIDWHMERLSLDRQPYARGANTISIDDTRTFLLPQGELPHPDMPPQSFILRYGKVPSLIVSFPSENEMRLFLWELHEVASGHSKVQHTPASLRSLEKRYRILLGIEDTVPIPLSGISSPQELELTCQCKKLMGKNYRFTGLGKDLIHDRVYIREKIRETIQHYGFYMVRFLVRVPCTILEGNKELIEVAGTPSSGLHTKRTLENANLLMVAVDSQGISQEVSDLIKSSKFPEHLLSDRHDRKAMFLQIENPHDAANEGQNPGVPAQMMSTDYKLQKDAFKEKLQMQWKNLICSSLSPAPNVPMALMSPQNIDRAVADTPFYNANPVLFSSIHLRDQFPPELLSGMDLRTVLNATNIPSIISTIPNRQLVKSSKQVKVLSNEFLASSRTTAPMPSMHQTRIAEKQLKIEQLATKFLDITKSLKGDLSNEIDSVKIVLKLKTRDHMKILWRFDAKYRDHPFPISAPPESHHVIHLPAEDDIFVGTRVPTANDVGKLACGPLLEVAPEAWQNMVTKVEPLAKQLVDGLNVLVKELLQFIELQKEKTDLCNKALAVLQESQKELNNIFTQFAVSMASKERAQAAVKTICVNVLRLHSTKMEETHLVFFDLHSLPNKACEYVQQEFASWVSEGLQRLSQLEELFLRTCENVINNFDNEGLKNSKKRKHAHFSLSNVNQGDGSGLGHEENASKVPHRENYGINHIAPAVQDDIFSQNFPKAQPSQFHFGVGVAQECVEEKEEKLAIPQEHQRGSSRTDQRCTVTTTSDMMIDSEAPNLNSIHPRIRKGSRSSLGSSYKSTSEIEMRQEIMNEDLIAKTQDAPFQAQLSRAGLVYKSVKADGNMQFRALADQVYGTESAYSIVRLLVVSEIIQNQALYERHLPLASIEFQEYCAIMSRDGCSGDHLTLNAFANFYGADVLVYSASFTHPMLIQSKRTLGKIMEPIRIAHRGEDEWESLVFPQKELLKARARANNLAKRPASSEIFDSRTSKRAKTGEHTAMETEVEGQENPQATRNYGKVGPISLVKLCLEKVVENIDACPPLQGLLPTDILNSIIESCTRRKRLSDAVCARLIDPTMTTLRLKDNNGSITDVTLFDIARKCSQLQCLELINCVNATNKGIEQIAANCTNLEHLILQSCSGVGNTAIQEVARKCPGLISINLHGCVQVTDIALQELELACPNLTNVILSNCNQLTDSSLHYIGKNTLMLDMSNCEEITDTALLTLSKRCEDLRVLKLPGHNLSDMGIIALAKGCRNLSALSLSNCSNIHNAAIHTLARHCPRLEMLSLESCRSIDDEAFDFSFEDEVVKDTKRKNKTFYNLHTLNLARCLKIGNAGITRLVTNCPNIRQLVLNSCQDVTDEAIFSVAKHCPYLEEIDLSNCNKITDQGIIALAAACPNLVKCILSNCNLITDLTMESLSRCCPKLEHINVSCCSLLTDKSLESIAENCPKLKHLWLEECAVTEAGLTHLKNCINLKCLKLGYIKDLTDSVLEKIAQGCPKIKELDLSYCGNITSECLGNVLKQWFCLEQLNLRGFQGDLSHIQHTNLEQLNLSWCKMVDDSVIGVIAEGCPNLVGLDLAWNPKITGNSVHKLASRCKSLRSLNLRGCTRVSMLTIQYLSGASSMVIVC